ncbi:TLC domain-containing protein 1 [Brachionichthys hirsutus]|uniref:TLC domain-containing protein 1 n=1 Tax=Brachionichthys hirsutus TaxID=412623 RepID=UPI0036051005
MDTLVPALKSHPLLSVLVFSLIFRGVHHLLRRLPTPKAVLQNDMRCWKWRNLSVSIVHSLLTSAWSLSCVVASPELLTNVHLSQTPMSYLLICLSTGYFVQDACDIILTGHARGSWEFLLHHAMVISCFLYALCTEVYIAGAVIALFVEVNSVTLHLRLMLKLANAQSSSLYCVNKYVNVVTYVLFRLGAQFYLTWYLFCNYSWLESVHFFLLCLILIDIMMLIYFRRLLLSDFYSDDKKSSMGQNGTCNNSRRFLTD